MPAASNSISWDIFASTVVLKGGTVGSQCNVHLTVTEKHVVVSTDEMKPQEYRKSKIKICDPSGTHPGMAQLTADGLKVLFPIRESRVAAAVGEVKAQLEGRAQAGPSDQFSSTLKPTRPPVPTARSIVQKSRDSVGRASQGKTSRTPPVRAVVSSSSGSGSKNGGRMLTSERVDRPTPEQRSMFDSSPQAVRPSTEVSRGSAERRTADSLASLTAPPRNPVETPMQTPLDLHGTAVRLLSSISSPSMTLGQRMEAARRNREQFTPLKSSPARTLLSSPPPASPPLTIDAVSKVQRFFTAQRKVQDLSGDGAVSRFQGIGNIGNSCYMNSVLQGLFGSTEFIPALLKASSPPQPQNPVVNALGELARLQQQPNHGVMSTVDFKCAVDGYCGDQFRSNEQHDAHEFLSALMDLFVDEIIEKKGRGISPAPAHAATPAAHCNLVALSDVVMATPQIDGESMVEAPNVTVKKRLNYDDENDPSSTDNTPPDRKRMRGGEPVKEEPPSAAAVVSALRNDSPLCGLFPSVVRNHITCDSCGKSRTKEEIYRDFSLEMGTQPSVALDDLLSSFFSNDKRELACEHCKDSSAVATVSSSLATLPDVLVIHLKRFKFDRESLDLQKSSASVNFPVELSLSHYLSKELAALGHPGDSRYQLCCVVRHHGDGARSGHYICDKVSGSEWQRCDDSVITQTNQASVLADTTTPYIFFYARKQSIGQDSFPIHEFQ